MLRKLPDKISRFLIYLTAFGVSALMAIMLIHIIKESIPAFSELGIKCFSLLRNGGLSVQTHNLDYCLRLQELYTYRSLQ